jgi:hypothetical protein
MRYREFGVAPGVQKLRHSLISLLMQIGRKRFESGR